MSSINREKIYSYYNIRKYEFSLCNKRKEETVSSPK